MTLPKFITFTGVDADVSVEAMLALSGDYPIEYGVLLSPTRQGGVRFPAPDFIRRLGRIARPRFQLAAHLCDGYSERLIKGQVTGLEATGDLDGFCRAQVNTQDPNVLPQAIAAWAASLGKVIPILPCRRSFPDQDSVQWLFDESSGSGTRPASWPPATGDRLVGYAGGINIENVTKVVDELGKLARNYWIDMATGVRGPDGKFDLDKCQRICEAIYGTSPIPETFHLGHAEPPAPG